jgi:hypothetical protein
MSFREHEVLQQRAEYPAIRLHLVEGEPAHGRQHAGFEKMQLGRLDDPFQRFGEPGQHRSNHSRIPTIGTIVPATNDKLKSLICELSERELVSLRRFLPERWMLARCCGGEPAAIEVRTVAIYIPIYRKSYLGGPDGLCCGYA